MPGSSTWTPHWLGVIRMARAKARMARTRSGRVAGAVDRRRRSQPAHPGQDQGEEEELLGVELAKIP